MRAFKNFLLILSNILMLPLSLVVTFSAVWYTLPAMKTTVIGEFILGIMSEKVIFWLAISALILFVTLIIMQMVFDKLLAAKLKNFFIHLDTWFMCLLAITLAVVTFILVNPLMAAELTITTSRKICIGIILVFLILYHMFSNKVLKLINRRIQAYETTKESNIVGRSSVIATNILKLFELLFPEMLVLGLLCYCVSWNIASYFLIVLVSTFIPMFGNIKCDLNIRNEIKRRQEIERDLLAEKTAERLREGRK